MAGLLQVDQFWCEFPLRTGSKFIGWMGMILGVLCYVVYVLGALCLVSMEEINEHLKDRTLDGEKEFKQESGKETLVQCMVLSQLLAWISVSLLIGIYKKDIFYYTPWLGCSAAFVILTVFTFFGLVLTSKTEEYYYIMVGVPIYLVIHGYFYLVITSDLTKLMEAGEEVCPRENFHAV